MKNKNSILHLFIFFLLSFVVFYAVLYEIPIKDTNKYISVIIKAKVQKDDIFQLFYATKQEGFLEKNSIKVEVKGSSTMQSIIFKIPDSIAVKILRIDFGTNSEMPPIKLQKISIQHNGLKYSFNKNEIYRIFPNRIGFTYKPVTKEFYGSKVNGIYNPFIYTADISLFYESVRKAQYQIKNLHLYAILIALILTTILLIVKQTRKDTFLQYYLIEILNVFEKKNSIVKNTSILAFFLLLFIVYLIIFLNTEKHSPKIKYRYNSISYLGLKEKKNNFDYRIFDSIPLIPSDNLIYNGNFEYGLKFWTSDADSTTLGLISTPFGTGVRVSRTDGNGGYWSLKYNGRPIIYYPGHNYQIKFKFKIIQGDDKPFRIGWWVNDYNKGFRNTSDLRLSTKKLKNNWYQAEGSYVFVEGHKYLVFFMNSLEDYSIVDIANIQLLDLYEVKNLPPFADQIEQRGKTVDHQIFSEIIMSSSEKDNLILNGNFKNGLQYWIPNADSTTLDWISTPFGKGVKVSRTDGNGGYWSLFYIGPQIEYFANHVYEIEFKFKVVKGKFYPFKVGWWVKDGGNKYSRTASLSMKIEKLTDGWYQANTSYKFIQSHKNLPMLFNSFDDFSVVEFTDIKIKSDTTQLNNTN